MTASTSVSSAIAHVPRRVDVRVREEQLRDRAAAPPRRRRSRRASAPRTPRDRGARSSVEHARSFSSALEAADALVRALLLDARLVDVGARIVGGRRAAPRGSARTRSASARRRRARARPRRAQPRRPRARRGRRRGRRECRNRPPCRRACSARVCASSGVEIAHSLLLQTKTTGAFITAARLTPSWNSPSLVAPSPKNAIATVSSPRSFLPQARPGGVRHVGRDRHADRRDVPVGRVPPAGRVPAPPLQERLDRQPADESDRRLAVRREDPVVVA